MQILIAILFLICFEVVSYFFMLADAKMDNIAFHRIHLGLHPLKDYWHLQKQIVRFCLFVLGALSVVTIIFSNFWLFIFLIWALSFIKLKKIWASIAKNTDLYYFNKDETIHISTGCPSLDEWLGFKW
ncbi:MAG TPA: hypothetical protein PKN48_00205 [Bacteroidales bacterium]|nr:hypothetical protein [Bacteroidales bacterium]